MKDFEVIDDVISIGYQNRIKDYMACPNYPWFYGKAITHGDQSTTDPCLLYTSPSPRDLSTSRMPSSA